MKKLLLAVVLAISGCAVVDGAKENPTAARLAVTIATMKVIEAGGDPVARAVKVAGIAKEAKRFLDSESVTLAVLEQSIRARLADEQLAPSDHVLADALVTTIAGELRRKLGDGLLSPEQRYTVSTVLDWVATAAGG